MAVAAGMGLRDETNARAEIAAGLGVGGFVAGTNDDAKLFDAGVGGFFEDELQGSFRFAVRIDERLERKGALARVGGGDEGFANFHAAELERSRGQSVRRAMQRVQLERRTQGSPDEAVRVCLRRR